MKIDVASSIEGLWLAPMDHGHLTSRFPLLGRQHGRMIPLRPGLNVIYGRNGAGKTQLLRMIAQAAKFELKTNEGFVLRNPMVSEGWPITQRAAFRGTPREVLSSYYDSESTDLDLGDFSGFNYTNVTAENAPLVLSILQEFLNQKRCLLTRSPDSKRHSVVPPTSIQLVPMLMPNDSAPITRLHAKAIYDSFQDLAERAKATTDRAKEEVGDVPVDFQNANAVTGDYLHEWLRNWSWSPLINRRNFGRMTQDWAHHIWRFTQSLGNPGTAALFLPAIWTDKDSKPYGDFPGTIDNIFAFSVIQEAELSSIEGDWQLSRISREKLTHISRKDIGMPDENEMSASEEELIVIRQQYVDEYVARIRAKLWFLPGFRSLHANVEDGPTSKVSREQYIASLTMKGGFSADNGSDAERRWLRVARAAEETTTDWVIIDEPESGLHRIAEAELAEVLGSPAWNAGSVIVVATHSPEFLDLPDAHVLHIDAGDVRELTSMDREELSSLGLRPADLITRIRTVLLVEGEHELAVFETLFADELQRLRCKIIPTRGARNMKHVFDSQIIFYFSDAKIIGLMDNLNAQVITDLWAQAQEMARQGNIAEAGEYLRSGLPGSKSSENLFLREFMSLALKRGEYERVEVWGLSKEDIVLYMEPSGFGLKHDWPELLKAHASQIAHASSEPSFKPWLNKIYGADFSDDAIRRATRALDYIPEEFGALLMKLSELHQPRGGENESV